jgi:hypothetical protein
MSSTYTLMPAASLLSEVGRVRLPYAGIAAVQACSAPKTAAHGTRVPAAAFTVSTLDAQDAPGSPPREAPV